MIYSMTGFGKARAHINDIPYQIELKSLNSKYFDLNVRLPQELRGAEPQIRKFLENTLKRGKIQLSITPVGPAALRSKQLNEELLQHYHQRITSLYPDADTGQIIAALLRHPDMWFADDEEDTEKLTLQLLPAIEKAVEELKQFRKTEGERIEKDLRRQTALISDKLEEIRRREPLRKEKIRTKLREAFRESGVQADPERFEEELIYYLDRLDINEEMQRLETHLKHFDETLRQTEPETKGKKLQFIAQEMGREINTTGSKANDAAIQSLVVEMKDALEKIKEQTANIL